MALTFAELGKLERLLITEGATHDASTELNVTADWLRSGKAPVRVREMLTRLAEAARKADNRMAAEIALGSLVYVRREFERDEGRCLAVLRFAQQRVDSIESANVYWANVVLSADDEEDARALFEAAIGDTSYSTRELIETANKFANLHHGENSFFGRLSADLVLLVEVVESGESRESIEIARAALTYFAEKADAISDDLGLVGLLDDAYVVQRAIEHICPNRACLTTYLEDRVRHWPFLRNLMFDIDNRPTPISDYLLINCALLLDVLDPETRSTVVLVDDVGPLPYLLGFVAALAQISKVVEAGGTVLERGDRLMDRDGKGEVVFNRYFRQEGQTFVICDAQLATHAQVVHPARGRVTEVLQTIPVAELGNFRRTAIGIDRRKRNVIKVNVGDRKAGSLEQLFGTTTPIMLDPHSPVILVVAPIQKTKQICEDLKLFGAIARDVVPTGHLRRVEDAFEIEHWSKHGIGGEPMLWVVRSVDEAYEAVVSLPFEHRSISMVVAAVRQDSPDATQLARIKDSGVSVLAFTAPEDCDALELFTDRNMSLWSWNADWFRHLFWPRVESSTKNTLLTYELHLRQRLRATNQVETVQFDELSELATGLVTIAQDHDVDNEPLTHWMKQAWLLLLRFCRWLTPIAQEARHEFEMAIENLTAQHRANQYRWSEDTLRKGQRIIELYGQALKALGKCNPKYERLLSLASKYPGATMMVAERDRARVAETLAGVDAHIVSRNLPEEDARFRIIPAWYGRSQMETLAFNSIFERQTLLLYEPEAAWFGRAKLRREKATSKTNELVSRHAAIPFDKRELPLPRPIPDGSSRFGDVDEVLRKSIYSFVTRSRRDADERVVAIVVGFVGGSWAAFTHTHRIVVSHLINDGDGGAEVTSTTISDLMVGDTVLLLRGSERNAVRELANLSLSNDTIRAADMWKRALKTYVHVNPDLEELRQKLSRLGPKKSAPTIRIWISDDYTIGPQHAESVIPAIAEATSSAELHEGQEACLAAIGAVRSAHAVAGKRLAKLVVDKAREWANAGAAPDDLVELEDQLYMATVDFIDAEQIKVPIHLVNRLQS